MCGKTDKMALRKNEVRVPLLSAVVSHIEKKTERDIYFYFRKLFEFLTKAKIPPPSPSSTPPTRWRPPLHQSLFLLFFGGKN
jgi:hypothetical protein